MNDEANEALVVCSGAMVIIPYYWFQQKRKRRLTNLFKKRPRSELLGVLKSQLISDQYKNFTRMSQTIFEDLLIKIGPTICKKKKKHLRQPISIQISSHCTIFGDRRFILKPPISFRISKQAFAKIAAEVCAALVETLKGITNLIRA
ncbi:hypothetical protein PR048_012017 [Dryococelus australis]|uniref:Uncharacterized protein n=1 Tax=Dryococelus australis TaxID=614101 RepID=A0ABQ9HN78_9NEOP|nr:hypothetical protein PR048_012017 [Dryococelus australis]